MLITGGKGKVSKGEVYDPESDTWTDVGEMTEWRAEHAAVLLADGRVLVTGGIGKVDSTDIFDPETDTFSPGPKSAIARYAHSMTLLDDGRILIVGGNSTDVESGDRAITTEVEIWTP